MHALHLSTLGLLLAATALPCLAAPGSLPKRSDWTVLTITDDHAGSVDLSAGPAFTHFGPTSGLAPAPAGAKAELEGDNAEADEREEEDGESDEGMQGYGDHDEEEEGADAEDDSSKDNEPKEEEEDDDDEEEDNDNDDEEEDDDGSDDTKEPEEQEPEAEEEESTFPYTGPCENRDCGVHRLDCRAKHMWCVPWPVMDPEFRQGCTCSHL